MSHTFTLHHSLHPSPVTLHLSPLLLSSFFALHAPPFIHLRFPRFALPPSPLILQPSPITFSPYQRWIVFRLCMANEVIPTRDFYNWIENNFFWESKPHQVENSVSPPNRFIFSCECQQPPQPTKESLAIECWMRIASRLDSIFSVYLFVHPNLE